jgi:hypothetical protein
VPKSPASSPPRRAVRARRALAAAALAGGACAAPRRGAVVAPPPAPPPAPAPAATPAADPAPRPAAGVRLDVNWGVDTAAVAQDYTAGNRPNPVPAVLAPWRAYLEDRPDSLHPSPHWSAAEQRALAPGAEYDFTRAFVFPGRRWARAVRTTVLDVTPAEADSSAWQVRTLFAAVGRDSAVRALGVVRTRVAREGGRWVLASPLAAATRGWRRERVGRIAYVSAPGRAFDRARAARAARFVDSLALAFGVAPPDSIAYLVAGSADEAQRALGMEWTLATPGRAYAAGRFVYSGDPRLGEFYAHELAHLVLDPVAGAGVPGMAQEGVATWVGGSLGRDFASLMRGYGEFLRGRPDVTLTGVVRGDYAHDAGWRPAGALLFQMVHERGGMPAVRALLAGLAGGPRPVLYLNPDERFAAAVARALGVSRPALDARARARALRYAEPAGAGALAEPSAGAGADR